MGSSRKRIQLIHWNADEAVARVHQLTVAGYEAAHELPWNPAAEKRLRADPPDAVVIDLTRLPSQGRDWGIALRSYESMLRVPLLFVEGDASNHERIRKLVPDAIFTEWTRIVTALRSAIANPPRDAVKLKSRFAGYADTPLAKKLGIDAGSVVALIDAPTTIDNTLGELPKGALLLKNPRGSRSLTMWFVTSRSDLMKRIAKMTPFGAKGGLWIIWPKIGAGIATDLNQIIVRKAGLDAGLVDFRISRIDATWAGLRFTIRK
ncbi:MAG TPA: hypothetical protein VN867_15345 [Candidatus Binataceae bacterium]|nr:hypothetical protein [Candidatus Binataceae bacterium]